MQKLRIIADDKIPFLKGSPLEQYASVTYLPGAKISRADLMNADALITRTRTKCNASLLEGTPIRFIATATIGFDHIDAAWCESHGIVWKNAPGCNAQSVAQYITSVLVNIWPDPAGKTIGIVGAGHVGKKVEAAVRALGMNVLLNDPPRAESEGSAGFVPLETIQKRCDCITFHVPLEKGGRWPTFHLADESFFRGLGRKVLFINASRGPVAETAAVRNAVRNGLVSDAVLDVWENEPEIDRELLSLVRFGTPHIAGYSTDGKANGTSMSVQNLAEFFGIQELKHWFPENVPAPAHPEITGRTLADFINASYRVAEDSARLAANPEKFEALRGGYPLRREFSAFTVKNPGRFESVLRKLGFQC